MDRFVPLIGVEIHPVENGALEYKGDLHIMHQNHTEKLSPAEMWSLVHILKDGQHDGDENQAVYMTKLVSMYKNLKCGYDEDIDKELCQIIKKEEDMFKTCHHRA